MPRKSTKPATTSSAARRRSGRVPMPVDTPTTSTAAASPSPSTAATPTAPNKNIDDINWRHPAELTHIFPEPSTQADIIPLLQNQAFTIPPPPTSPAEQFITITCEDGTSAAVPLGYRIPLLFCAKYLWESVRLVLTSVDPPAEVEWGNFKFDLLNLSRLCYVFLENARSAGLSKRKRGGLMSTRWRSPMFDRVLTRYWWGWMVNREEFIRAYWMEFKEEEYEKDVLRRDWKQLTLQGHKGFHLTPSELANGITAQQFMSGLTPVAGTQPLTYTWDNDIYARANELVVTGTGLSSEPHHIAVRDFQARVEWDREEGRKRKRMKIDPGMDEEIGMRAIRAEGREGTIRGAEDGERTAEGERSGDLQMGREHEEPDESEEREVEAVVGGLPTPPPTGEQPQQERARDPVWSLPTPAPSIVIPHPSPPPDELEEQEQRSIPTSISNSSPLPTTLQTTAPSYKSRPCIILPGTPSGSVVVTTAEAVGISPPATTNDSAQSNQDPRSVSSSPPNGIEPQSNQSGNTHTGKSVSRFPSTGIELQGNQEGNIYVEKSVSRPPSTGIEPQPATVNTHVEKSASNGIDPQTTPVSTSQDKTPSPSDDHPTASITKTTAVRQLSPTSLEQSPFVATVEPEHIPPLRPETNSSASQDDDPPPAQIEPSQDTSVNVYTHFASQADGPPPVQIEPPQNPIETHLTPYVMQLIDSPSCPNSTPGVDKASRAPSVLDLDNSSPVINGNEVDKGVSQSSSARGGNTPAGTPRIESVAVENPEPASSAEGSMVQQLSSAEQPPEVEIVDTEMHDGTSTTPPVTIPQPDHDSTPKATPNTTSTPMSSPPPVASSSSTSIAKPITSNPEVMSQVLTVVPGMLSQLQSLLEVASIENTIQPSDKGKAAERITAATAPLGITPANTLMLTLIERMNALESEVKTSREQLARTSARVVDLEARLETYERIPPSGTATPVLPAVPNLVPASATPLSRTSSIDEGVPLPIKSQRKQLNLMAMSPRVNGSR